MKLSNSEIVKNDKKISDFPPVVVDQTNVHISDIIKRNLAGEQVLGTTKLSYDYLGGENEPSSFEVNPFSDPGFDLDDMIVLADKVGMRITDLQDRKGKLDQAIAQKQMQLKKAKEAEAAEVVSNINEAAVTKD